MTLWLPEQTAGHVLPPSQRVLAASIGFVYVLRVRSAGKVWRDDIRTRQLCGLWMLRPAEMTALGETCVRGRRTAHSRTAGGQVPHPCLLVGYGDMSSMRRFAARWSVGRPPFLHIPCSRMWIFDR